ASAAEPFAAGAAAAAARPLKIPVFDKIDRDPLRAVADKNRAPRLTRVVAERPKAWVAERVDERAGSAAFSSRDSVNHRSLRKTGLFVQRAGVALRRPTRR